MIIINFLVFIILFIHVIPYSNDFGKGGNSNKVDGNNVQGSLNNVVIDINSPRGREYIIYGSFNGLSSNNNGIIGNFNRINGNFNGVVIN